MTTPTREEVLNPSRYDITAEQINEGCFLDEDICDDGYWVQSSDFDALKEMHLTQEEKLKDMKRKCKQLCCRVGVLEMENQALKAKLLILETHQ